MAEELQNLPIGWVATTVGRVGTVRLGRQRSPDKQTGRYSTKYLRAGNITQVGLDLSDVLEMDFTPRERSIYELRNGDIVLAEASGSETHVGRAALWSEEIRGCCFQNTVVRFRPHAVTPQYALTVFQHYTTAGVFAQIARGVGILHLGASRFAEVSFPLPPLAEQNRIVEEVASRLEEIREAKASLRSAMRHIEDQTRAILAAAVAGQLVDQEAVLAHRERRSFEHADSLLFSTVVQTTHQASMFDPTAKRSPDAESSWPHELPTGWTWARVDQVGHVDLGKMREPKSHHGADMRPYLRVANVYEDRIATNDVMYMNFTPREYEKYSLTHGDILLNEGQSPDLVGRSAMYRGEVPHACFQNTLLRFRAGPAIDSSYAHLVFRHYLHAGEFRKVARWSTNIAHLSLQRFASMPFPIPPLAEQTRIAIESQRRLHDSSAQEAGTRVALDKLREMEAELLAAAVSGRLTPQDEADEGAERLLERLGSPPDDASYRDKERVMPQEEDLLEDMHRSGNEVPGNSLADVLKKAGRPLSVTELFSLAHFDKDSTSDVEQFYLLLRAELGQSIREVAGNKENAELEVITDAP